MYRISLFLLTLGLLASCGSSGSPDPLGTASGATSGEIRDSIEVVYGIGRVEPEAGILALAASSGGIVASVQAKEGEFIKQGTPILSLRNDLINARINQSRKQIATQEAQVSSDEQSLESARLRLVQLEQVMNRTSSLASRGAATPENLETDSNAVALQRAEIKRLERVVQTSRSRIQETRANISLDQQEIADKSVLAPADGVIMDLMVSEGEAVQSLAAVADFVPSGPLVVRAEIDELYANQISLGQPVTVRRLDTRQELAKGKIIYATNYLKRKSLFSGEAGEQEDRRVREIKVLLDDGSNLLINSRVEVVISL